MTVRASRRLFHAAVPMAAGAAVAVLYNSWIPAAVLVPLAGLLVLAYLEVVLPIPRRGTRTVSNGDTLLFGDRADVVVRLPNAVLPLNLQLEDAVPEGLRVEPNSTTPFQPDPGGGASLRYTVRAERRGSQRFGLARLKRVAPLGLLERDAPLAIPTTTPVLPPSARDVGVRVRPRPPARSGLPTRSARRGPGDEFYALREYLPGDAMGDVNWKATARAARVITNEFLPDEPPRYLLYVDARAASAERGQVDAFERTLHLAAILGEALLEARAQVGLVLLSFNSAFLVPGSGANQLRRFRTALMEAMPGEEATIRELVLAGVAHLPARADAILLTPNVYDSTLEDAVVFLQARHRRVAVLAPAFPEAPGTTLDEIADRASGALLNAEQAAALARLGSVADTAEQWPPGEPIPVTLGRLGLTGRSR